MSTEIQELKAKLEELEKQQKIEREALRQATKRFWQFTFKPMPVHHWNDKLWDDTLVWYELRGKVLNADECKAAGWPEDSLRGGAMLYLFNKGTGKIVMHSGGGMLYILGESSWDKHSDEQCKLTLEAIERVIHMTGGAGGDITDIIVGQKGFCL